jgi:hypothetical protein
MMNQEDIFKKVGQILNELQDQYEFLAQNPKQLNELELELFLANANFLSDHVQILRKINSNKPQKAIPEHTKEHTEQVTAADETRADVETPVQQLEIVKKEELPHQEIEEANEEIEEAQEVLEEEPYKFEFVLSETPSTDKFEFEEKSVDDIFDRPLSKEEEQIIAQKQQRLRESQHHAKEEKADEVGPEPFLAAEETTSEPVAEPVTDKVEEKLVLPVTPEPVLDKVEEKVVDQNAVRPTLNDLLAGKNNQTGSLNEENNKTTITDLKQAINLNQKLLYIKDLFNGYNLAYAEAIELINKMPDFKTADTFLQQNYAVKNNWASKQSTVDQFYELLNQRFPKA